MTARLAGKRVLVTQSQDFMGPVLCRTFAAHGAEVIADARRLDDPAVPAALVAAGTRIDVLIANLGIPRPRTPAHAVSDEEWRHLFAHLVDPLPRLFRAVLPQMLERRSGKIVLMGSASALRGMKNASTYSAARGAQLAYVQAVGVEWGRTSGERHRPEFRGQPTYFRRMQLYRGVPGAAAHRGAIGGSPRPGGPMFALFLASDECNFFVANLPVLRGW